MLATDSAEFGIIRLIVDIRTRPWKPSRKPATSAGSTMCWLWIWPATSGTLDKILTHLKDANVFVRYLYISFDRKTSSPIVVLKTDEPETETFLQGKGYTLLDRF